MFLMSVPCPPVGPTFKAPDPGPIEALLRRLIDARVHAAGPSFTLSAPR